MNQRSPRTVIRPICILLCVSMLVMTASRVSAQADPALTRPQLGSEIQLIPLKFADAADVANVLNQLLGAHMGPGSMAGMGPGVQIVAEQRTNALLISAPPTVIEQVKAFVEKLDQVPLVPVDTRQIKIFSLVHVEPSSSLLKMLSVVDTDARVAFDPDRKIIVAAGSGAALDAIEAFLMRIDQLPAGERSAGETAPQELQVRIVWLAGDLENEPATMPPPDLENVVRELGKIGVSNLEMVAQIVVNATEGIPFTANGSARFTQPCSLKLSGTIGEVVRGTQGAVAKSKDPQLELEISAVEDGPEVRHLGALQTTITAPVGQTVVLGVTPIQSKPSVFIVQLLPVIKAGAK